MDPFPATLCHSENAKLPFTPSIYRQKFKEKVFLEASPLRTLVSPGLALTILSHCCLCSIKGKKGKPEKENDDPAFLFNGYKSCLQNTEQEILKMQDMITLLLKPWTVFKSQDQLMAKNKILTIFKADLLRKSKQALAGPPQPRHEESTTSFLRYILYLHVAVDRNGSFYVEQEVSELKHFSDTNIRNWIVSADPKLSIESYLTNQIRLGLYLLINSSSGKIFHSFNPQNRRGSLSNWPQCFLVRRMDFSKQHTRFKTSS